MRLTYDEIKTPSGDLQQGDVLDIEKIPQLALRAVDDALRGDGQYFLVLSQTCDLVRRDGKCKAEFISLAPSLKLDTVLQMEVRKFQRGSVVTHRNICSVERFELLVDFLKKLMNNNQPGLFFIPDDPECGITRSHVARLDRTLSLHIGQYDQCRHARVAQLKEIFQAKLGWLVGHMYSRVGTPDWVPSEASTEEEWHDQIRAKLDGTCAWIDDAAIRFLESEQARRRKESGDKKYRLSDEEIRDLLDNYVAKYEERQRRSVEIMVSVLSQAVPGLSNSQTSSLRERLLANEEIRQIIR